MYHYKINDIQLKIWLDISIFQLKKSIKIAINDLIDIEFGQYKSKRKVASLDGYSDSFVYDLSLLNKILRPQHIVQEGVLENLGNNTIKAQV